MSKPIRVTIRKTREEWAKIEELASSKYPNQNGKKCSRFITNGINLFFKNSKSECSEEKTKRNRKDFDLILPEDVQKKLECESKKMGISIGEFISKKILDPNL